MFTFRIPLYGYKILYAEQYYKLYHQHLGMTSDDIMENIVWLEEALKADFANPLYALAQVDNDREWEQYRNLFRMHVNLKIVELHLRLGSRYDKRVAYFYNAPWREQNLESLEKAETLYETALYYWKQAISWARKVKPYGIYLEEIQNWQDEAYRIRTGELDYYRIIGEQLERVRSVREAFEAMDDSTY